MAFLFLLQGGSVIGIQAPSYEPAACFSQDQKERLTDAATLAGRLPDYVVLVGEQGRKLKEFLRTGSSVSGEPWGPASSPSFDEAIRGTSCVVVAVREDLLGESLPQSEENEVELDCLAEGMKKLETLLESALKENWFFDHQRRSLSRALWEVEEAEAALARTLKQARKSSS